MKLKYYQYDLQLKHTFTIARSSRNIDSVVLVEIEHDGIVGYGEASPSSRYGENADTVSNFLSRIDFSCFEDPFQLETILRYIDVISEGNSSAKAAIDIALHDWIGKKVNLPLYKYWGLDRRKLLKTSFTIGIDKPEVIEQKVREAEEYPILKIKLGLENDKDILDAVRRVTQKTIRVDANEGWKTKEIALEKIKWLQDEGVELVEQPLPASDLEGTKWLKERVSIPIIADENCVRLHHVPGLKDVFDGINIKLMKCTGLREAQRMIHTAQACNLKIMMGCMIESSIAISAAAQLSPLIDFADLDGHVLTTNDPFEGILIEDGNVILRDRPGIGVMRRG